MPCAPTSHDCLDQEVPRASANSNRHCFPGCQCNPSSLFYAPGWNSSRDPSCSFPANPTSPQIICSCQDDLATQTTGEGQARGAAATPVQEETRPPQQLTLQCPAARPGHEDGQPSCPRSQEAGRVLARAERENCTASLKR